MCDKKKITRRVVRSSYDITWYKLVATRRDLSQLSCDQGITHLKYLERNLSFGLLLILFNIA